MPDYDPTVEEVVNGFLVEIKDWYEFQRKPNGKVNSNVMSVGMILLHHMTRHYPLKEEHYLTASQVKEIGGKRIAKILDEHGEKRTFTSEGGRTSRGTMDLARRLAKLLNEAPVAEEYEELDESRQAQVRSRLQCWFVEKASRDYFDQRFIEAADFDPNKPSRAAIAAFLRAAGQRGGTAAGALAQHLVGAKLAIRFPKIEITNESYTTADRQTARPGDFRVGDTAFHVTMSPSEDLFRNRCKSNINNSFRPVVLVPANRVAAALQMADSSGLEDRVAVSSIEDFVGTNVDEMAEYTSTAIRGKLRQLLELYNKRVRESEPDPALQVEIPENL